MSERGRIIHLPSLYYTDRKNVLVSQSFGRTSAMMCKLMMDDPYWQSKNLLFAFANTSKERIETLEFGDRITREWGIPTVWVEAVVHHGQEKACTHRVVSFQTAKRNGEVFEEVIKKYGIPNQSFPHCTRELKSNPLRSLAEERFGGEPYVSAIGMRFDEIRRVKQSTDFVYPLAAMGLRVGDVRSFWNSQTFDLALKDYEGNCDFCWKKSKRKLLTLARENPSTATWWAEMETKHANSALRERAAGQYNFHRKNQSTAEIIAESQADFIPVTDPYWKQCKSDDMDTEQACHCMNSDLFE